MIVVDTNIVCYLFISGPYSEQAAQALEKSPLWVAPSLWRSEFRNVLTLYMRKNLLTLEQASLIMQKAEELLEHEEYEVPSYPVLEVASISECTGYDCEFIVLAQDLEVPLLTADKKLLKAFPDIAISLTDYLAS